MVIKFQATLTSFTKTLQSRKMFKNLQLEPRDPANYDLDYVLKVASMVQEHKEGLENTQTIKKFVRRCCKGAAENNTMLKGFLSMIPSDTYGSVLSGGLTLILAVRRRSFDHLQYISLTDAINRPWKAMRSREWKYRQHWRIFREG